MKDEKENIPEENIEEKKNGFFKKYLNAVIKIEKYPDMAAEGIKNTIKYLAILMLITAIIMSIGIVYQTNNAIQKTVKYIADNVSDFEYKDGILTSESEQPIILENTELGLGKITIDLNQENEEEINKYINQLEENDEGIVVLKDKIIVKSIGITGSTVYNYKDTFEQMNITEFNKDTVISYMSSSQIYSLYISLFMVIFIFEFIMFLANGLWYALILGLFGYLVSIISKIKMKFVAIYNMSIYALTLSFTLYALYIAINIFVPFKIQYFDIMYTAVAAIYLIAAIFMIKADFIKKQVEVAKIEEIQKEVEKEIKEENKEKKEENKKTEKDNKTDKKEKSESKKKKTKKEEQEENDDEISPEGENV